MRSPKRKRDEEAEEETPVVVMPLVVEEPPAPEVPVPQIPVPQVPVPVSIPDLPKVSVPEVPVLEPARPKKRARTAMHMVAHTAAAMAIGAAATWSALAFS